MKHQLTTTGVNPPLCGDARFDWWNNARCKHERRREEEKKEKKMHINDSSCLLILYHQPDPSILWPERARWCCARWSNWTLGAASAVSSSSCSVPPLLSPPAQAIRKGEQKINCSLSIHYTFPNGCSRAPKTFSKLLTCGGSILNTALAHQGGNESVIASRLI